MTGIVQNLKAKLTHHSGEHKEGEHAHDVHYDPNVTGTGHVVEHPEPTAQHYVEGESLGATGGAAGPHAHNTTERHSNLETGAPGPSTLGTTERHANSDTSVNSHGSHSHLRKTNNPADVAAHPGEFELFVASDPFAPGAVPIDNISGPMAHEQTMPRQTEMSARR